MNNQVKVGLVLFILGFIGVLSLLASEIPIPQEAKDQLLQVFTPTQIKLLTLINPTFFLIGSIIIGCATAKKVNLQTPVLSKVLILNSPKVEWKNLLLSGINGGLISAASVITIFFVFIQIIPNELSQLQNDIQLRPITRFLYGGITEELLIRFGLMTLIVFLLQKISKSNAKYTYWIGILLSAFLFALGHLPVVINTIGLSAPIFTYILLANATAGILFGWLYWKKGIEAAMIAHITFHAIMIPFSSLAF